MAGSSTHVVVCNECYKKNHAGKSQLLLFTQQERCDECGNPMFDGNRQAVSITRKETTGENHEDV